VLGLEHRTPGKGNALIMATIRSFQSGKTKDIRFASSDKVEIVNAERQKLEYSYSDQSGYHFMDPNTFETVTLDAEMMADAKDMLIDGIEVEVLFLEGKAAAVDLPPNIEVEVTSSPPGVKGDTANAATKEAVVQTGLRVQVPLFINEGDRIKIDTRTGKYTGRV
jgi:elongation factor P